MSVNQTLPLPESFKTRMFSTLGDEYPEFIRALESEAPVSVRMHPCLPHALYRSCDYEAVPWEASAFYLKQRPVFGQDPWFHAGAYYVQEASSMAMGWMYRMLREKLPQQGLCLLDACASPGGKSTHLLSIMNPEDVLVSNEYVRGRYPALVENIIKWGFLNICITQTDTQKLGKLQDTFDLILIDAPCSGEGLFRKDPESRLQWSEEQVEVCVARQFKIINDLLPALKPGGILLYSTCTYAYSENEAVMEYLLEAGLLCVTPLNPPGKGWKEKRSPSGATGWQALPNKVKGEGFFISAFQKKQEQSETKDPIQSKISKTERVPVSPFPSPGGHSFSLGKEGLYFIHSLSAEVMHKKMNANKISSRPGLKAGIMKGDKFIPDPELAFWKHMPESLFPELHLSMKEAVKYLQRETFSPEEKNAQIGIHKVMYRHLCLGWANVLNQRINNLYPLNWRLRAHSFIPEIPFPEQV